MHPLTVTWAPHIYTPWGWENFQAWIHAGFDNYPVSYTHLDVYKRQVISRPYAQKNGDVAEMLFYKPHTASNL